jgi:hypothetical protein
MVGGEEAPILIITSSVTEIRLGEDAVPGRADARSFGSVSSLQE